MVRRKILVGACLSFFILVFNQVVWGGVTRETAGRLVAKNFGANWRLAQTKDFDRSFLGFYRKDDPKFLPNFCTGYFNEDRKEDFAILIVKKTNPSERRIVVFHGRGTKPVFIQKVSSTRPEEVGIITDKNIKRWGDEEDFKELGRQMKGEDGIEVIQFETDSYFLFWDGRQYQCFYSA